MAEDEMVGWHHQLSGLEFPQSRDGEGQGSLACCSSWVHKESDMTERLNNKGTQILHAAIKNNNKTLKIGPPVPRYWCRKHQLPLLLTVNQGYYDQCLYLGPFLEFPYFLNFISFSFTCFPKHLTLFTSLLSNSFNCIPQLHSFLPLY